jgi:SAM-dependent methyltransferase
LRKRKLPKAGPHFRTCHVVDGATFVMFFAERVRSIKETDRVLEVGPGGTPHPRSDVLLEYRFDSEVEAEGQRGYAPPLKSSKPVIHYTGTTFPFKDQEFDYVICSHVIEHVADVTRFVRELNRVAKAGYLEYPTIYYDYVYNFPEHISLLKLQDGRLFWMAKTDCGLAQFKSIQHLFYLSLARYHYDFVEDLKLFFFEGFEWQQPIEAVRTSCLEDLVFKNPEIPPKKPKQSHSLGSTVRRWAKLFQRPRG